MTRDEFIRHIASLNDYSLYRTARNIILNQLTGSHRLKWKLDLLAGESAARSSEIYSLAMNDAYALFNGRQAGTNDTVVCDIIRSSLMTQADFAVTMKQESGYPQIIDNNSALAKLFGTNSESTFICRVSGDSMIGENISENDILIVDTSVQSHDGRIVVASVGGIFFVKKFVRDKGRAFLVSANEKYKPVPTDSLPDFKIIGVVRSVLHSLN